MRPWLLYLFVSVFFLLYTLSVKAESLSVSLSVGLTHFSINGYTSPNALVTLKNISGVVVATSTSNDTGYFSLTIIDDEGVQTYSIFATDDQGVSTATVTETVSLTVGSTTTIGNLVLPPSITTGNLNLAVGSTLSLYGYVSPSSTVRIFINGTTISVTATEDTGYWGYNLDTTSLLAGSYPFSVRSYLDSGYSSSDSSVYTLKLTDRLLKPAIAITLPTSTPIIPSPSATLTLPVWLILFDIDHDGALTLVELDHIVSTWIQAWIGNLHKGESYTCDLNQDNDCTLVDLSILLYHINR